LGVLLVEREGVGDWGCCTYLADVGEEADDLIVLVEQPFENGGGVETTGVGEADLSLGSHDAGYV
jgi:hypothetical protein